MKKSTLLLAAVLFAALFAFKAFFPAQAGEIIEKVGGVIHSNIDYRQVFSELGRSLPVFGTGEEEPAGEGGEAYLVIRPVELAEQSGETLKSELAVNSGETSDAATEEEIPAAVAAFLESQAEYSDFNLPDNVSYDYSPYPYESAVPVAGYNSSGFGYRLHPIKGEVRFHYGTDFAAWSGEDIFAFADGTVSFAGYSDSYGNYITIDHSEGWKSLYAHCSRLLVETGDQVSAGEKIALVGQTGLVTGPHLHFELTKDGVYVNPEYYVN